MENPLLSFSIVVPVYNEEAIVINSIEQNISVLDSVNKIYEIIIVNDASRDSSKLLIENNFSNRSCIKIIHHEINSGFGGAVRTGISNASFQYILCVPVDSPLTEETFAKFIEASSKADIIVSYRIARLGYTPRMRLNSWIYHLLIELIFDIHFVDFNWIHLYNRKIFDDGNIEITSKGIFMLVEVLIKATKKGYTFYEIPVDQSERMTGVASASKFSVALKTLMEIVQFCFK